MQSRRALESQGLSSSVCFNAPSKPWVLLKSCTSTDIILKRETCHIFFGTDVHECAHTLNILHVSFNTAEADHICLLFILSRVNTTSNENLSRPVCNKVPMCGLYFIKGSNLGLIYLKTLFYEMWKTEVNLPLTLNTSTEANSISAGWWRVKQPDGNYALFLTSVRWDHSVGTAGDKQNTPAVLSDVVAVIRTKTWIVWPRHVLTPVPPLTQCCKGTVISKALKWHTFDLSALHCHCAEYICNKRHL